MTESTRAVLATDALITELARDRRTTSDDPVLAALAALAAEVDATPVPEVTEPPPRVGSAMPRMGRRAGVAVAVTAVVAFSSSSLAAAVTGDPLLPLRYVVGKLYEQGHTEPGPTKLFLGANSADQTGSLSELGLVEPGSAPVTANLDPGVRGVQLGAPLGPVPGDQARTNDAAAGGDVVLDPAETPAEAPTSDTVGAPTEDPVAEPPADDAAPGAPGDPVEEPTEESPTADPTTPAETPTDDPDTTGSEELPGSWDDPWPQDQPTDQTEDPDGVVDPPGNADPAKGGQPTDSGRPDGRPSRPTKDDATEQSAPVDTWSNPLEDASDQ